MIVMRKCTSEINKHEKPEEGGINTRKQIERGQVEKMISRFEMKKESEEREECRIIIWH